MQNYREFTKNIGHKSFEKVDKSLIKCTIYVLCDKKRRYSIKLYLL